MVLIHVPVASTVESDLLHAALLTLKDSVLDSLKTMQLAFAELNFVQKEVCSLDETRSNLLLEVQHTTVTSSCLQENAVGMQFNMCLMF